MTEIRVVLKANDSLADLLGGQWALRFWLVDRGDGTYGLHAALPGNASSEALCRFLAGERRGVEPPQDPPSADVAEQMERWAALMERLPEGGAMVPLGDSGE